MSAVSNPNVAAPAPEAEHGKLREIQILRGISIVSVLFFHLSITPALLEKSAAKVTMSLFLGVEIFFIISGYVIANSLARDQFSGLRFFIKRAFRLLPAIVTYFVLSFALNVYFQRSDYSPDMKNLFSVPQGEFGRQALAIAGGYFVLLGTPASYCNGAMWSLSIEDQFYAALTLLCLLGGCLGARKPNLFGPMLAGASGLLYVAIMTVRIGIALRFPVQDVFPALLMYLTNWRFDFLALGILLAFAEPGIRPRLHAWFRDCGQFTAPFLIMIPFMLGALGEPTNGTAASPRLHGIVMPVASVLFGLLVLLAANNLAFPATKGPIQRAFVFLGDRSYTIYVFHFLALALAWMAIYRFCPSVFSNAIKYGAVQALIGFAIMLPMCEAIHKGVELPLAKYGRRLAASLGPQRASGDAAPPTIRTAAVAPVKQTDGAGSRRKAA